LIRKLCANAHALNTALENQSINHTNVRGCLTKKQNVNEKDWKTSPHQNRWYISTSLPDLPCENWSCWGAA